MEINFELDYPIGNPMLSYNTCHESFMIATVTDETPTVDWHEYRITFHVPEDLIDRYGEDPYWCYITAKSPLEALGYFHLTHSDLKPIVTYFDDEESA